MTQTPILSMHGMQVRAAALTGTQCASYDAAKQAWMARTGMGDTPGTHLGASMITGAGHDHHHSPSGPHKDQHVCRCAFPCIFNSPGGLNVPSTASAMPMGNASLIVSSP